MIPVGINRDGILVNMLGRILGGLKLKTQIHLSHNPLKTHSLD